MRLRAPTSARMLPVVLVVALAASLLVAAPAPADAQAVACPEIMPVSEVAVGAEGTGYTVDEGTTPEPFTVEVIGVLDDGIAAGIDMIVVEADSEALADVGSIWAGISGSPVYIDGRLVGALAYGLTVGPSLVGGLTPAEHMAALLDREAVPAPVEAPREVPLPPAMREHIARDTDLSADSVATLSPLPVPVAVTGLGKSRQDWLSERFEEEEPNALLVGGPPGPTGSSAAESDDSETIDAGGNVGVGLSYGDVSMVGIGTTTMVCDDLAVVFGHPFFWDGRTGMSLHPATAVDVIFEPLGASYKLANTGPPVGTVDIDGRAGVRGRLGEEPESATITSSITNEDERRTATGRTDVFFTDMLPEVVMSHLWANYDVKVHDDVGYEGTTDVAWRIDGEAADGSAWRLERTNRHADPADLATASIVEIYEILHLLQNNEFEEVEVASVDYTGSSVGALRRAEIIVEDVEISTDGVTWDALGETALVVAPGRDVLLRVPLRRHQQGERVVELALQVPFTASGAVGQLVISGGSLSNDECLFAPELCGQQPGARIDSFGELLESVRSRPRNDEVVARLQLQLYSMEPVTGEPTTEPLPGQEPVPGGEPDPGEDPVPAEPVPDEPLGDEGGSTFVPLSLPIVTRTTRVAEVVAGQALAPLEVTNGCPNAPAFSDVGDGSAHSLAIGCAGAIGITRGVDADPPRFEPTLPVTRAQAAGLIARALRVAGYVLPEGTASGFADVAESVHAEDIDALAAAGIVSGRTAEVFAPGERVRRDQVAALLVRSVQWAQDRSIDPGRTDRFPDVPASNAHVEAIASAADIGLVQGLPSGRFAPAQGTRRDQMASLLLRLVDFLNASPR